MGHHENARDSKLLGQQSNHEVHFIRSCHRDEDVGELVLDRLERADGAAEGITSLGKLDGRVEAALRPADLLEGLMPE